MGGAAAVVVEAVVVEGAVAVDAVAVEVGAGAAEDSPLVGTCDGGGQRSR